MKKFGTMRAAPIALMLTVATPAGAECGNLCDYNWWKTATTADVQAELDGDADVMARNKLSYTPLHAAARYGSPANIQDLIDAGADVMARSKNGSTPLHWVADRFLTCKPGVIQALLAAGADAKAKNKEGKIPWDFAQNNEDLKGTKGYWALNDAQYN